jgi:hypothetical protein
MYKLFFGVLALYSTLVFTAEPDCSINISVLNSISNEDVLDSDIVPARNTFNYQKNYTFEDEAKYTLNIDETKVEESDLLDIFQKCSYDTYVIKASVSDEFGNIVSKAEGSSWKVATECEDDYEISNSHVRHQRGKSLVKAVTELKACTEL